MRALDRRWLLLGRSLAATPVETLLHIVLPGVISHVLTGIRLAIGIAWIVLVPCEMLGVSSGLGYLILNTRDALAYSDLMGVILVIGSAASSSTRWLGCSNVCGGKADHSRQRPPACRGFKPARANRAGSLECLL